MVESIEIIRHYAKISQLRYESAMSDLLYSGGDLRKVNVTMNKKMVNGDLSKIDVWTYRGWIVIDEQIPSWIYKEFKKMSNYIDEMTKK